MNNRILRVEKKRTSNKTRDRHHPGGPGRIKHATDSARPTTAPVSPEIMKNHYGQSVRLTLEASTKSLLSDTYYESYPTVLSALSEPARLSTSKALETSPIIIFSVVFIPPRAGLPTLHTRKQRRPEHGGKPADYYATADDAAAG